MLDEYSKKRHFEKTPEPPGEKSKKNSALIFVVQKHEASHLHYDLRLEADGVLKSWAVPKGPSLNPENKRLAMMVEDHPLEYANFEGVIPEGNYGAGTVMVWDRGEYHSAGSKERDQSEKDILNGLAKGHISFVLEGAKLRGEFALVRLKKSREENAWLLIKANDEFANSREKFSDRSSISGKTMKDIASNATDFWSSAKGEIDLSPFPEAQMPQRVRPMLATLIDHSFDHPDWYFEIKWDGYRAIAQKKDKNVFLYSRNGKNLTEKFPEIASELTKIPYDFVIDGEIVVLNKEGKPEFSLMQNYPKTKEGTLRYYIFDLLWLSNHLIIKKELDIRRQLLEKLPLKTVYSRLSEKVNESGGTFFRAIQKENLEGMMAKRKSSPYKPGERSKDWLKIKTHLEQEAIIIGYTDPQAGRQYLGSLLLGVYEKANLQYIGNVGTGFSDKNLHTLYEKLNKIAIVSPPVTNPPKMKSVHWTEPKLIAEIKFQEWTKDNLIRQGVFLGLREDIDPREVTIEKPKELNKIN